MSLRTAEAEQEYQNAKKTNKTFPLEFEPKLHRFRHWYLIDNRFPYDSAFEVHHMLLPDRAGVTSRKDILPYEWDEFENIVQYFVEPNYDLYFMNTIKNRSVKGSFHIHLGKYKGSRDD